MPLIDALEESEMDREFVEEFAFFRGTLGDVPNSIRTMARVPEIARAYTALNKAVMTDYGTATLELKRLVGYVASFASGCLYCQAHMILASERFGATEERLNDVYNFEQSPHFTAAEKAALAFAHAAASVPNLVTEEIADRLRAHWSDQAIVEITAVVALFGYLNRWNDSMGTALEELPHDRGRERLADATGWEIGKHNSPRRA